MKRRNFWTRTGSALLLPGLAAHAQAPAAASVPRTSRAEWLALFLRTARPVIDSLAAGELKKHMPVEALTGNEEKRRPFTHLEAIGRSLAGIAPWLACPGLSGDEESSRAALAAKAVQGLSNITDSASADRIDFTAGSQCLVDAAFLALAMLRAPRQLWEPLSATARERLIAALKSTRKFKPGRNNWLLFSASVEAFLASIGQEWLPDPIGTALSSHEEWYKGDGAYGDGPEFHWDYYNSFVIQPMLLAVLDAMRPVDQRWEPLRKAITQRAVRYAAVQERLIASDGSYPALGRSITYRCGAFHHLADMALRQALPASLPPARARRALGAAIQRTLGPEGTFSPAGWLQIGLSGHQPSLAEGYISTGSLYLCLTAFLPLGLPPANPFWSGADEPTTAELAWSGRDLPADHALH